jgi:signal transduction histidine kinase/ligand-binding sensor domain-containing protein
VNRGVFILLSFCSCAFALNPTLDVSQYAHSSWKIREGFITGSIFTMAQTPDGYLWFGTAFGLFRFDGTRAVRWQPPDGGQLPSQRIDPLLVGRDGTLWIATDKGLASWRHGKLITYPEIRGRRVDSLLQDAEGTLWFGVENPGRLCAVRAAKTQCYGAGSFGQTIPASYQDHKGNLWVSSETGLWRWAPGHPENYSVPGNAVKVHELLEDDKGELLMATSNSLGVISGAGEGLKKLVDGKIRSYPIPDIAGQFRPTRVLRSSDGSLWVGTLQGLLHLHQGMIDRFTGLSGGTVFRIFEDREGSVWVSTQDGLDRFRESAAPTISVDQGLSNSAVHGLEATPDGSIWISAANGLSRWQNGHVTVYGKRTVAGRNGRTDEQDLIINSRVTEIPNSGLQSTAHALGRDDRGRLWIGGREGMFYFDGRRFVLAPGISGGSIFSIAGDRQGGVWISNDEGLFYRASEGAIQRIDWDRFGHKNPAADLLADQSQGGLWLGFVDGGIAYFRDGQVRSSYNAADGLSSGAVTALQRGSDGVVWVATAGGLSRVKDGRVTTLTSKNGLPCDGVSSVIEDDDRSLWLYMPCGLVRIARSEVDGWVSDSKRSVRTTVFDSSDGVRTRGVTGQQRPLMTKSADGKIWFAPPDAVSFIDPHHLAFNNLPPPVHIEQITADGKTYDAASHLRLPALTRDLQIDYTALSLVAPEKNRFKYMLEGYNSDWQAAGNRRQAFYSNLPPSNYTFRVMASNNSGVWNQVGDSVDFSIAPAYYQTVWFRLSLVAAFFGLLWTLYRYRLHQLAREFSAQLEGRVDERTRIARELHDTLLQSFQAALFEFQAARNLFSKGREEAIQTLDNAISTAQEAIVEGRDAIHGLRETMAPQAHLEQLLKTAGRELASSQVSDGNRPAFRMTVEGPPQALSPALQDEVYQIGREVLRNAFRHASASRIEAEIRYSDRLLRLRIRDDGKGIDQKVLEKGIPGHWGLPGMRERAKRIGARLVFWSEAGAGTEVELAVPSRIAYAKSPVRRRFGLFRKA